MSDIISKTIKEVMSEASLGDKFQKNIQRYQDKVTKEKEAYQKARNSERKRKDSERKRKESERKRKQSEGTCGYGIDGKVGDKPAGPHLLKKKSGKLTEGGAQIATGVLQKIGYGKPLGGTVGGITKENILQPKLKRRPSKTT